jgi:hypothetical protein
VSIRLPRPAAPLWVLLPALVLLPLLLLLPAISHGGGWGLVGEFLAAALRPSLEPLVLGSALEGLAITVAMALLGWAASLGLGLLLGVASSQLVWHTCGGARLAGPADPPAAGPAPLDPRADLGPGPVAAAGVAAAGGGAGDRHPLCSPGGPGGE